MATEQHESVNGTGSSGIVDMFLPAKDVPMQVRRIRYGRQRGMEIVQFVHPALYQIRRLTSMIPPCSMFKYTAGESGRNSLSCSVEITFIILPREAKHGKKGKIRVCC